jgi:hypothetical protein
VSYVYRAVLHGDRLQWSEDVPEHVRKGRPVVVYVTVPDEEASAGQDDRGRRMAEALEKLAAASAQAVPRDPVAWQRETREERSLPGR